MTRDERDELFTRYDAGPALLREAWRTVPEQARQWRPGPGKWSAHEVVVHCADSETNSAMRIRYLVGEVSPLIVGYDQDRWATGLDYHGFPPELSLRQIDAVRAWTSAFIRALPESSWTRSGRHTEYTEPYTAEQWLRTYAEHLEIHARQIQRTLDAWRAAQR
jgi:hypothetical protein